MAITLENPFFYKLACGHRQWLSGFDGGHCKAWENILKGDIEAAVWEANVVRLLQELDVRVEPNERQGGSGPDFWCSVGGEHFYVEATCIQCSTATKKTGCPEDLNDWGPGMAGDTPHADEPQSGGPRITPFRPFGLTEAIFNECKSKARQCCDLDAPTLVAVGTFHVLAKLAYFGDKRLISSLLTGVPKFSWNVSMTSGRVSDLEPMTELERAAFVKPDPHSGIGFARSSISGILACTYEAATCLGVLHPNPARPFNPELLPAVAFGSLVVAEDHELEISWPDGR